MQGGSDENPVFSKVPGNVEVGVSKNVTENIEHPPIKIPPVLIPQKKKMDLHETSETKNLSNSELQRTTSYSNEERNTTEKENGGRKKHLMLVEYSE
ncbi:hypothetical protein JTB14_007360 [Gonioctena quinquepunctata]|nr:hypothetical protein JTB14_007360 [Gonioctena quinquepunctata]